MSSINAIPWFAWVAIIAIVTGAASSIVAMLIKHRERMAMIERGMNPDDPGEAASTKTRLGEL